MSITINHSDSRKQKEASTCAISLPAFLPRPLTRTPAYGTASRLYSLILPSREIEIEIEGALCEEEEKEGMKATRNNTEKSEVGVHGKKGVKILISARFS